MAMIVIGLAAGVLSSMLGVGGGVIIVPALMILLRFSMTTAIGTSLAIIVPTAIMGALRHRSMGNIDWAAALLVTIGGLMGAWVGPALLPYIPVDWLKRGFAAVLIYTAYRMIT